MSYLERMKRNNQFLVNHAWPGICSLCFEEVAEFNGSDANGKPVVTKFKMNYRRYEVELSDDTLMTTTLCSDCYENINESDYKSLMKSEELGWSAEIDMCIKGRWSKERKSAYKERYGKLKIKQPTRKKKEK